MKYYGRLIFSIPLVAAVALAAIFFSGEPGKASQGLSRGIATWLLDFIYPEFSEETLALLNYFLRRGAHLTIYFLLGFGLATTFQWQKRVPPVVASIVIGVLFAATDEFHQLFSSGRTGKASDVLLDACGIAAGSVVAHWWQKRREKKK